MTYNEIVPKKGKTMKNRVIFVLLVIVMMVVLALVSVQAQDDDMMELPPSVEFLVESFYGDTTGFEGFIHEDWQWMGNGQLQFEGHEGFQNAIGFWSAVFPDIEVEVLDAIGDEDVWALRLYMTGTNTVDFAPMGVTATGNSIDFYVNAFIYLEDDMISECHLTWDWITWFDALGMPYGSDDMEEADD